MKALFKNTRGFTLTEVMIGMMILTVAIVSATNLLISLNNSNKSAVSNLQAYYLAQEGLEAVRNIRDTNWLHNEDWLGDEIYPKIERDNVYSLIRNEGSWGTSTLEPLNNRSDLTRYLPWSLGNEGVVGGVDVYDGDFLVLSRGTTEFFRHVEFEDYPCGEPSCDDFILVRSVVNWKERGRDNEVVLEELLTNWKQGVL